MPSSSLLALLVILLSLQVRARETVPLADFVVISKSRGAKSTAIIAGRHSQKVRSFKTDPRNGLWTLTYSVAASGSLPRNVPAAEQAPPDVPVSQKSRSVGAEKAQSHPGLSAVMDSLDLPESSFCIGKGIIVTVLGSGVLVLNATSGLAVGQPFDVSSGFNSSLISTACIYDPAASKFYLAANNGSHILVAVSTDPSSSFVGPFILQANGLDPTTANQALPGFGECVADPAGSCRSSDLEVSVDQYGLWVTVQLLGTSASPRGSLLLGIPKDSLARGSSSIPPFVAYSSWATPYGSDATDLHLSHVQADGSHAIAEEGTLFVLASNFANSSILIWAITDTASLSQLAKWDDTSLPAVSEVNAVVTYPVVPPSSVEGLHNKIPSSVAAPNLGVSSLSSVTFDHNTGYLWTAAQTAITINGGAPMVGAAYFVIKPDILNGEFKVELLAQGYTTYSIESTAAQFFSPVITVNASLSAQMFGMAFSSTAPLAQAYVPVSLEYGPGAIVYTVKVTSQGSHNSAVPLAAHAGVDEDGTFWMMSGEAQNQEIGCPGASPCTSVQTTITRFQSKAADAISRPADPPAVPVAATPPTVPLPTAAPTSGAAVPQSTTAPPSSAIKSAELAPAPAQKEPAAASGSLLPWSFGQTAQSPPAPPVTAAPVPTATPSAAPAKPPGADSPTLFGMQLPKWPTFGPSTLQSSPPVPASQAPPSARPLSSVETMKPAPTPSPLQGLFQLPKLPTIGQPSPPQPPALVQATPSETPKPETVLGFNLPKLPSFGQQYDNSNQGGGKSAPWGFKLPFSFQAAAPESADIIGPAQAPDVAVQAQAAPWAAPADAPSADGPSAVVLPEGFAGQFGAPAQATGSVPDSSFQQAPRAAVQIDTRLLKLADAEKSAGSMAPTNAHSQAPVNVPMGQPEAARSAPGSESTTVSQSRPAQSSSYPLDTATVEGAVEALFVAQGPPSGRGKTLQSFSSP